MKTGIKLVGTSVVGLAVGFVGCLLVVVSKESSNPSSVSYSIPAPPPTDKRLSKMSFTLADMYDANGSNSYWYHEEEKVERVVVWQPTSDKELQREIKCLAMNMYFEAGNQSINGKLAVANVTLNRVYDKRYPNTLCGVVWQSKKPIGGTRHVAQFSWTRDGMPDVMRANEEEVWELCFQLARTIVSEGTLSRLGDDMLGATHYHAHYVDPYWADRLNKVAVIEDHLFYRVGDHLPINRIPGAVASLH